MTERVPTVRVKPWAQAQGGFVEINAADYDPTRHALYDEPAAPAALAEEAQPEPVRKRKRG